jgi:4'-phosphopantetheinyl transferase
MNIEPGIGEIHVWNASLNQPGSLFYMLFQTLSEDECRRAQGFRFKQHRNRFICCHGILRIILANYLNVDPVQLQFRYEDNGKPGLVNTFSTGPLFFNLSYSEGTAVYAFSKDGEIGVDVEQIRDIPEMKQIVGRYFSAAEKAIFYSLLENERREAFFNWWTRKEAFIKATGDGLSYPLNGFDVSLTPGEQPRLMSIAGDTNTASRWSIQTIRPGEGFIGALAFKGQIKKVKYNKWPYHYVEAYAKISEVKCY